MSHAHVDHTGNLPHLVKKGFTGVIYSTEATKNLSHLMLLDSAYIQEQDAKYFEKRSKKPSDEEGLSLEPIYTSEDAEKTMEFFTEIPYDTKYKII